MTCPACGAPVAEGARFCSECGQRLIVAADERRLVTVLMADLVGFTALSAASDPEHVKRLVDACFDALVVDIVDFGGHLDKIVGDEVVALFGAPVAHEDDAERAVRAALRMHATLAALAPDLGIRVQMRIGVNTGEVLVGAMRAGGLPTVMGDVVNTAQRLQKLAGPGEVVVGPATHAATRASIRYEALGPQGLRGREEPVDSFRALEAPEPPGRRRAREQAPLLGRDAEIATLEQVVAMAARRQRAQLVLLSGEAGVGKSRLASELGLRAARDSGAEVLTGQCVPYGDANVFVAVAEAVRRACFAGDGAPPDAGPDDPGEVVPEADLRARVVERVTKALELPAEAPENERMVEGLMHLIDGVTRPGVDPTRARDDALRSTIAFFEALAANGPLVLTLSDLHWASDEALELCNRMLARLHNQPFVLVATTRPGLDDRWTPAPGKHNELALHLDPLDRESTAELVRALFCGGADDETVEFLLERSGGNPFFVEELVAFVQETRDSNRLHELPATLHGLVAARLDALATAERSLLEDCAIVGASGPIAAALALAARADGRRLLDGLAERDFLAIEHDEFHFKSELIREIAYGTLTKAERARRHAQVAPVLAARGEQAVDQAAHHLATAAELVDELGTVDGVPHDVHQQAIDTLMRAADRDESVESWLMAERHHDRALALLGSENTEARRTALLGRARARVHRRVLDDARDDALTALAESPEAGDRYREAVALTLLGEGEAATGAYDVAEATFGEALKLWRELDDESGAANVLRGLGMTHLFRGDLAQAERFVSEALGSFRSSGNQRGAAWALQNLAWISFSHGNIPRAENRLEESADLFGELGDWGGLSWAYGLLAFVRYNQGRLDEAAAIAEHISIEGRETGNRWAVGMMDVLLANVALWNGRTRECCDRGNEAIELFRDIGDRWGEVMATASVVRAYAELGNDEAYETTLERYREVARTMPDESMRDFPVLVEASVQLQRGHAAEAELALRTIEPGDANDLGAADAHAALGLARLQLGDPAGAISHLEGAYELATDDGPRLGVGCRLALAYAVAHRCDDARRVLEEMSERSGGTYSDRMIALWAESLVHVQTGSGDGRGSVDAAHAIATATDARLEHAIAALARAHVLDALDDTDAAAAHEDATRQLESINVTGAGWHTIFELALEGVRSGKAAR
jgi:class 3 adenylate cyclase/tetratricopeptide (TPR) repeat protein